MRVAVVYFASGARDAMVQVARGIAAGIESQGHQVDIIDAERERDRKLTIYNYIAVGSRSVSLFRGKLPPMVDGYLKESGTVGGKKSFAFILRSTLGSSKALSRLMATMEHEGMFIRYSEVLRSEAEARVVGSRLKIET